MATPPGAHHVWPAARFAGQTRFHGVLARCDVPVETASALLPSGLELDAGAGETHPLALAFGRHSDGATLFGGRPIPWGVAYEEFAVAVPGVLVRGVGRDPQSDGGCPRSFVPRMLTSYFPAIFDGNLHYGYSKLWARMHWDGSRFDAHDESGRSLVTAQVEPLDADQATSDAVARLALAAFDLPMLGCKAGSRLVESHFGLGPYGREPRPVVVQVAAEAGREGPLPCGRYAGRGLLVEGLLWRLGWPRPLGAHLEGTRRRPQGPPGRTTWT